MNEVINQHATYSAPSVAPYPLTLVSGEGSYIYDNKGKKYLDMVSGIAVTNFGHKPEALINAMMDQANQIAIVPRLFHHQALSEFLMKACELCAMDKAVPMNSGAEAVETAIKFCRKWAYTVKQVPADCAEIIVCDDNFHGRTITTISASSVDKYKADFGPLTPGFVSVPFNDPKALEAAITPNTAAFIVEPIQGEAGVIIPDDNYLSQCQAICQKNNVLFILDEIQTGLGRTGKNLASQYEKVVPDGILLGKALGGGLLPVSLFLGKNHLMNVIKPGEHGGTFGGNPLAARVASAAIDLLVESQLADRARELGEYFLTQLLQIKSPAIARVRGRGLMIAIELDTSVVSSRDIVSALMAQGLLTIDTHGKMIRLLPALTISTSEIDEALRIINNVVNDL